MSVTILLALAAVGLVSGFFAGLIGIGGGVLIVPFLYFFYDHAAWSGFAFPAELHVKVAHATSLLVIVPTAIRGTLHYSKAGLIVWRVAIPIAISSIIGGVLGARIAIAAPAPLLKLGFGGFLIATAMQLVLRRASAVQKPLRTDLPATVGAGIMVGILSGMMGVGGGLIALPILMYVLHVDMKRAAATSLTIVCVAALSSVMTYALAGLHQPGTPPGSIGYVHAYGALPILLGSLIAVPLGARTNQRLDVRRLRWIFAVFFLVMGLHLVIENLPILNA